MTTRERDVLRVVSSRVAAGLRLPAESPVDSHATFTDLGLDSAAMAVLAGDLDRELGISVAVEELYDHPTPQALASWASRQISALRHG